MIYMLKGCPRCHGDLYANDDIYGKYFACLQCGHYLSDLEINDLTNSLNRIDVGLGSIATPAVTERALAV